ncbi:MAG: hypothetical protein PHQ90_12210 [Sulfuricurvum sp.]|nr:hypothetical protein [Sulfuricurvum sp.]
MRTKDEQIRSYIRTWLENQYTDFFIMLLTGHEPDEVNPTKVIDLIIKMRFQLSPAYIKSIGNMIKAGVATREQSGLYYAIKNYKNYAIEYNRSLQKSFDTIYEEHTSIMTPLQGAIFHIYCFLKFGIKASSAEHDFATVLNYIYVDDMFFMDRILEKTLSKKVRAPSPLTNKSKAKSKWIERASDHGYVLIKRKIDLFPNW